MNDKKLLSFLLAGTIATTTLFSPVAVSAGPSTVSEAESLIKDLNKKEDKAYKELKSLKNEMNKNKEDTKELKSNMKETKKLLEKLKEEIEELNEIIDKREVHIADQARALQVIGESGNVIEFIMSADSLDDIVGRFDVISTLMTSNKKTIEKHHEDKELVEEKETEAKNKQKEEKELAKKLEENKKDLDEKEKKQEKLIAKIVNDKSIAKKDKKKLEDELREKELQSIMPASSNVKKLVRENSNKGRVIKAYPHRTFKSYMRWTALSTSSPQGKLSAKASPDSNTAIMKYNGRYLVALGFAYADHIGQEIDVVMESGEIIPVIVGDFKAKAHTDSHNSTTLHDGSIIEFIVSSNDAANRAVNRTGSYNTIFPGKVKEFRK